MYDGSLAGIIDRFSGHKLVTLAFDEETELPDLSRFGEVVERRAPKVKLRVDRPQVATVLAAILDAHTVSDVSVEDPPLEDVIAQMFAEAEKA